MKPAIDLQVRSESARLAVLTAALFLGSTPAAHAAVTISSGTTANMSCANGSCAPTAKDAVLNVGDLGNMLASGNVEVTTTGAGVQAKDMVVKAALTWSASNALTLDAYQSIMIDKPVSVTGLSALTLTTNDGGKNGELSFGPKGNVTFANLSSSLTINGAAYTLVNDITTLASDVAANSSGDYAFANNYDARRDGTYQQEPITTAFTGTFEGLGNAITHYTSEKSKVAFFGAIYPGGSVRDFGLLDAKGFLADVNDGLIEVCHTTGLVKSDQFFTGGLVSINEGTISDSYSTSTVWAGNKLPAGGLVGANQGSILNSYATGTVTNENQRPNFVGGLAGANYTGSVISNSYATGAVTGGPNDWVGGFVAGNEGSISSSYSIGLISGGANGVVGGFLGENYDGASVIESYWDTTTSDTNIGVGSGASSGVTGLTTEQLQSGLPQGFDPMVWAEKSTINDGLPYLLDDPPPHK